MPPGLVSHSHPHVPPTLLGLQPPKRAFNLRAPAPGDPLPAKPLPPALQLLFPSSAPHHVLSQAFPEPHGERSFPSLHGGQRPAHTTIPMPITQLHLACLPVRTRALGRAMLDPSLRAQGLSASEVNKWKEKLQMGLARRSGLHYRGCPLTAIAAVTTIMITIIGSQRALTVLLYVL